MRRLAIEGGSPAFAEPLHVGGPNVVNRAGFQRRLDVLLDTGRLTNFGPFVREFEEQVAAMAGARHCVAVCNGTVGLEIAIRALGLEHEVIVPSWTFVATPHALQWQEITPVFADVSDDHTLDPAAVEAMMTPRTSGILGVHLWGRPCDHQELRRIANERGLKLLYDAAHAFGVEVDSGGIGALGDIAVFSFHATKFLNTFEGGAIVTNDEEIAEKARLMANFGFAGQDQVIYLGTNGKMSEVSAAMGLAQLEVVDDTIVANYERYQAYERGLAGVPGVHLLEHAGADVVRSNHQYIVCDIDATAAGLSRDELLEVLRAENVLARRYFFPGAHRMEPYRSLQPHAGLLLPQTNQLAERTLVLPTGTSLSVDDVDQVTEVIRTVIERARTSRTELRGLEPTARSGQPQQLHR